MVFFLQYIAYPFTTDYIMCIENLFEIGVGDHRRDSSWKWRRQQINECVIIQARKSAKIPICAARTHDGPKHRQNKYGQKRLYIFISMIIIYYAFFVRLDLDTFLLLTINQYNYKIAIFHKNVSIIISLTIEGIHTQISINYATGVYLL
ncbi:hypothetical protein FWK35_00009868 [Aphis craccivora]|uniref:Uncharacterized protein n=1 Tax=Aphis craccivora TaxID=307492 RepID=A0A6G0YR49_APHCR|nr:hypothetical protein FWK35_00009868 [Aphis craccivora]